MRYLYGSLQLTILEKQLNWDLDMEAGFIPDRDEEEEVFEAIDLHQLRPVANTATSWTAYARGHKSDNHKTSQFQRIFQTTPAQRIGTVPSTAASFPRPGNFTTDLWQRAAKVSYPS